MQYFPSVTAASGRIQRGDKIERYLREISVLFDLDVVGHVGCDNVSAQGETIVLTTFPICCGGDAP